jgi:hypothetical protein
MSETETPVALYGHCLITYQTMLSEATGIVDDDNTIIVWEGMLTRLITSQLNLSVPYYTAVTKALKRMGCIRQLKRGGGTAPSQWELLMEPTEELFINALPKRIPKMDRYEGIQMQLDAQNNRILKLEKILENIIKEEQ